MYSYASDTVVNRGLARFQQYHNSAEHFIISLLSVDAMQCMQFCAMMNRIVDGVNLKQYCVEAIAHIEASEKMPPTFMHRLEAASQHEYIGTSCFEPSQV